MLIMKPEIHLGRRKFILEVKMDFRKQKTSLFMLFMKPEIH